MMNNLKMTGMEYLFDSEGETVGIKATYQKYDGQEAFNATAMITGDDLDDLTKKEIDKLGREKIVKWIQTDEKA